MLCASGMTAEARIARAAGFSAVVATGQAIRMARAIEAMRPRPKCLISFGVAGGLAPHLRAGDVLLTTEVIGPQRRWLAGADFRRRIGALARRIGAADGPLLGSAAIVASRSEKARLWGETGALAVDLESAVVAGIAEAAGIPFLVLRAIADPAAREVPSAATIAFAGDQSWMFWRCLAELWWQPQQIAALFALAIETRRALTALAAPARALRAVLADGDWAA